MTDENLFLLGCLVFMLCFYGAFEWLRPRDEPEDDAASEPTHTTGHPQPVRVTRPQRPDRRRSRHHAA